MHLVKKEQKTDRKGRLDRRIKKTELEIKILKHMLEMGAWSQENFINYRNNIYMKKKNITIALYLSEIKKTK